MVLKNKPLSIKSNFRQLSDVWLLKVDLLQFLIFLHFQLSITVDGFLRHSRQVICQIKIFEWKFDYFLRLNPLSIHELKSFQVNYLSTAQKSEHILSTIFTHTHSR